MTPVAHSVAAAKRGQGSGGVMRLVPRSMLLELTRDRSGRDPGLQSPPPLDEDYWLGHCEGFYVDGPAGRLGVVDRLVYRSRADRPDIVAVAVGMWRARIAEVPIADVTEVWPAQGRLVVRTGLGPANRAGVRRRRR
jgi:hypothetical protein